jgi:hypothetical protein
MTDDFQAVRLNSLATTQLLPVGFIDAVLNRYLPVLSFTFFAVLAGVAMKIGGVSGFLHYFLQYKEAYQISGAVCLWVSIPALLWILLRANRSTASFADMFYIIMTCMMVVTLLLTLFLFPDVSNDYLRLVRLFIVAAIPIHVIQYVFLVRGGLPFSYAQMINIIGITMFVYGFAVLH